MIIKFQNTLWLNLFVFSLELVQLQNSLKMQVAISADVNRQKHVNVYQLDDLLVACAQDIIVNGFATETIPDSIKEWVAGKVLKTLPKRLTQKLLSFVLDNRDTADTIGIKESTNGQEFTLICYKSKAQKERAESDHKQNAILKEKFGQNLPSLYGRNSKPDQNQSDNEEIIFDENKIISDRGVDFFSPELIMDQSQIVPMMGSSRTLVRKRHASPTEKSEEDLDDLNTADETDFMSQDESGLPKVKKRKKPTAVLNEDGTIKKTQPKKKKPANCPVCDKQLSSQTRCNAHIKSFHPDYWEKNKPQTVHQRRIDEMEEIVKDPDSGMYTCVICSKQFGTAAHIIRHVDCVHT